VANWPTQSGFHTIADFRKNSGPAIRDVIDTFRRFVQLSRELQLFGDALVRSMAASSRAPSMAN
jgi:hypothetical protein